MWLATSIDMTRERDERVRRLKESKRHIRENYSRLPWMDWFRKDPLPKQTDSVELEKGDVLAMILAVFSIVLPWVFGMGAFFAVIVWLITLIGG